MQLGTTNTKGSLTLNVTVELKSLRPAVTAAAKLSRRAYGNPGIELSAIGAILAVTGADSDITATTRVPATVHAHGTVTVDAKSLAAVLKGKGSVILSTAREGFLRVENGIATDLPAMPAPEAYTTVWGEQAHKLDLQTVAEVATAATRDEARPILTGILFDGASIVATDSYRLHLADDTGADVPAVLVPSRVFPFLPKSGAAYLTTGSETRAGTPYVTYDKGADGEKVRTEHTPTVTRDVVRVESAGATVVARVIDGEFPNYRQLIPSDQPHAVTFEREPFLKIVAAVGATVAKSARPVRLKVDGSELVVFAHDDRGEVSSSGRVPCKGDDLGMFPAVAFNPAFLGDAVATLRGDFATLRVTDSLKPASLSERQEGGANAIRLLMPVRT